MATIAWSIGAGAALGAGIKASGTVIADGVMSAAATVDAGSSRDLALQIDDVARVVLLIVTCTRYDGSISFKGGDAADVVLELTGPIMAFGAAASRLAASLGTVTIEAAADPATAATVSFFLATSLT